MSNWLIVGWSFLSKKRNVRVSFKEFKEHKYLINRVAVSNLLRSSFAQKVVIPLLVRLENGEWVERGKVSLFEDRNIHIEMTSDDHLYMMKIKMLTGLFMGKSKRIPVFALKCEYRV